MIVLKKDSVPFNSKEDFSSSSALREMSYFCFCIILEWKNSRIWGLSSETETPVPVQLQLLLSLSSSLKQRSAEAQKWNRQGTRRGCCDEVSASPGSTGNLLMKVVLVKIPAWFKQTPEAPTVKMSSCSPGRAPGLFCWRRFCSKPVPAWSQPSHCTSFKINSSQTAMKIGSKGDQRKQQINQVPPVFST